MGITTATSTVGSNYTVEISFGTPQEVADRIATLLEGRLWNINIFIEGFTYGAQGATGVLLRYITTPP